MAPMWYNDKEDNFERDALLHKLQSEVDNMTAGLTDKQKQLFQEDKYVLVDTIIILEHKLKGLNNELELCKEEIETERQARCAAEGAHIKAQQEIDGDVKPMKLKDKVGFDEKVLRAIGKYEKSTVKEEGENGQL